MKTFFSSSDHFRKIDKNIPCSSQSLGILTTLKHFNKDDKTELYLYALKHFLRLFTNTDSIGLDMRNIYI